MKIVLLLLSLLSYQISVSQSLKGKVTTNNLPISNVEVINMNSKEVVKTNFEGVFEIKAASGNWLTFFHKEYEIEKIFIDSLFNYNVTLEIKLSQKTIKIEEVVVEKNKPFLQGLKTGMPVTSNNKPNVRFSDGTVNTPVDFVQIGGLIKKLFKNKDKEQEKVKIPVYFRTFTAQSYDTDFLAKSLKLNSDEIEEFMNFCDFDPKSKVAVENSDKLILLQFLIEKSEEYKK